MGLIAIATSDGVIIDGRLDTPGTYDIYCFDDQRVATLKEQRSSHLHHHCRKQHVLPQEAALLLADVQLVLVTCAPRETELYLLTRGIMVVAVKGNVSEALERYYRRGQFLDELLAKLRRRFKKHQTDVNYIR